ncbi:DMT family transporter [Allorhizobium terrae]|uniref:DMT family transporter n=1 Tax=Allorhizobium terrae TaxID=1848972 RepID=A0A4S4A2D0_9HYPH|nr:DMT family transporter [Allorhizobium terrae]THF52534.1 DMT family transporter [Allorhizobium terrae]
MDSETSVNPLRGIVFKIASVTVFVVMQTAIKLAGDTIPAGQITFYRSAFALIPIFAYLIAIRQLETAFKTGNVFGHVKRGLIGICAMASGFYGLVHLPMPDAIAIGYAMPLIAVVFAAVFMGETVRLYRWSAVAVGLFGVVIISWPKLTLLRDGGLASEAGLGALAVLASAALGAAAMLQVRQLVRTEKTPTIVLYFSIIATLISLASFPFGWSDLSASQLCLLAFAGVCGGAAQILLTESYRYADISTIAPFEYSSILFGSAIGYVLFDDLPSIHTLIGTVIVAGAGIFIIFREHQLGLERKAARKASSPISG